MDGAPRRRQHEERREAAEDEEGRRERSSGVRAEGEPDELLRFARDRALLDVVVIQENDSNSWMKKAFVDHRLTASEYALSIYLSRRYTEPGRFVALPAWEWSHRTPDDDRPNHRTVLFAGADTPIVRHTENGGDFDELCDAVEAAGGVMFAQHESFRLVKRPCDAALETAAGWGVYIDPPDKIHADLSAGFKVGFVATSDGHRRNPGTGGGLTGIYAPELTPRAILEAVKRRRVYATSGSRVFLDARANGVRTVTGRTANERVASYNMSAATSPSTRRNSCGCVRASRNRVRLC